MPEKTPSQTPVETEAVTCESLKTPVTESDLQKDAAPVIVDKTEVDVSCEVDISSDVVVIDTSESVIETNSVLMSTTVELTSTVLMQVPSIPAVPATAESSTVPTSEPTTEEKTAVTAVEPIPSPATVVVDKSVAPPAVDTERLAVYDTMYPSEDVVSKELCSHLDSKSEETTLVDGPDELVAPKVEDDDDVQLAVQSVPKPPALKYQYSEGMA